MAGLPFKPGGEYLRLAEHQKQQGPRLLLVLTTNPVGLLSSEPLLWLPQESAFGRIVGMVEDLEFYI